MSEKIKREELEGIMESMKAECDHKVKSYNQLIEDFNSTSINQGSLEGDMIDRYQDLQKVCDEFVSRCEKLSREKRELERQLEVCREQLAGVK